jgi:haloacetate dehalogenase
MTTLGFDRFRVAGHDRGGRVTHRLLLDHPDRVIRAAVLDIIPTPEVFKRLNKLVATAYYHWFFLIQPRGLPETLIGGNPEYYLRNIGSWGRADAFTPEAFAEYLRCFSDPACIHATCEDYRAAASVDLEHHGRWRSKNHVSAAGALGREGTARPHLRPYLRLAGIRRRGPWPRHSKWTFST